MFTYKSQNQLLVEVYFVQAMEEIIMITNLKQVFVRVVFVFWNTLFLKFMKPLKTFDQTW